ncbi:MAG TPA: hypothetical protein VD816_16270 [Ohtaekwangia sp.]|nr:hypothetical protein [Ohtaekwangia sp.]
MIEVFKTNVVYRDHADLLLEQIHATFSNYAANFDLEDCDRILRIKSSKGPVECEAIIYLLKGFGFEAEVLTDEPGPFHRITMAYNTQTVR